MDYQTLKQKEKSALALAHTYRIEAEEVQERSVKRGGIMAWQGYRFESSSGLTPAFADFSRQMRTHLRKTLAPEFEFVNYSRGHFYFSAFAKRKDNGKLVYISCSNVRYWPDGWLTNLLIRTAQHDKDYTGGMNNTSTLEGLKDQALYLTQ